MPKLKSITILLALCTLLVSPLAFSWNVLRLFSDKISINLTVVDEQGQKLPYATVWAAVQPIKSPLSLSGDDLWRVTTRYQDSFEFVTWFHPIIRDVIVYPMANDQGLANFEFDYQRLEGSHAKRPKAMQLSFALMKRGYLPARVDFAVSSESSLQAKMVLKRNPAISLPQPDYESDFERQRYLLSDPDANENISDGNKNRIETLRQNLEASANKALAQNDKPAAARIYARMQHLPVIRYLDGKPIGYAQDDAYSEVSWAYLEKAYQLDDQNPYIVAEYLFHNASKRFGMGKFDAQKKDVKEQLAFQQMLEDATRLMANHGASIWPKYKSSYARWFQHTATPGKSRPLLEQLYKDEPKFETYENLMEFITP